MNTKPVILVVDDDGPILLLMRNLLREFGFDTVAANNGKQAVDEARSRVPDLVLVDKNMPGMSGAEVIRSMRDDLGLHAMPILILSGEPLGPDEITSIRATAAVQKPFDVPALIEQIRSHLSLARA